MILCSPTSQSSELALQLSRTLIQCPSITPCAHETFQHIQSFLEPLGFRTHYERIGDVTNFYGRWGTSGPHICFAGHVDVVPPGALDSWRFSPFSAHIYDGYVWGRGAADMKGAIACFMAAVHEVIAHEPPAQGSISFLLTSDEEGLAINGLKAMVGWLRHHHEIPDVFLIGEPTGSLPGEEVKVGRRGSLTGRITFQGRQGHIASPHLADNPISRLLTTLTALSATPLDKGTDHFEPSRLEITSVDTGNPVMNLIPQVCQAHFGIRFNPLQTRDSLTQWLQQTCATYAGPHNLDLSYHGAPFLSPLNDPSVLKILQGITHAQGGVPAAIRNTGGTSDGRFLIDLAPVVECGLPEDTIHAIDERIKLTDICMLRKIYISIIKVFLTSKIELITL